MSKVSEALKKIGLNNIADAYVAHIKDEGRQIIYAEAAALKEDVARQHITDPNKVIDMLANRTWKALDTNIRTG